MLDNYAVITSQHFLQKQSVHSSKMPNTHILHPNSKKKKQCCQTFHTFQVNLGIQRSEHVVLDENWQSIDRWDLGQMFIGKWYMMKYVHKPMLHLDIYTILCVNIYGQALLYSYR